MEALLASGKADIFMFKGKNVPRELRPGIKIYRMEYFNKQIHDKTMKETNKFSTLQKLGQLSGG